MKLWVDDIRTPPDDSWHIARSVGAAVRALAMFKDQITHINLDHDISHQIVMGGMERPYPCPETFETVAWFIAVIKEEDDGWEPVIQIHTSNPVGADKMGTILHEAGLRFTSQLARGANRLETIL